MCFHPIGCLNAKASYLKNYMTCDASIGGNKATLKAKIKHRNKYFLLLYHLKDTWDLRFFFVIDNMVMKIMGKDRD